MEDGEEKNAVRVAGEFSNCRRVVDERKVFVGIQLHYPPFDTLLTSIPMWSKIAPVYKWCCADTKHGAYRALRKEGSAFRISCSTDQFTSLGGPNESEPNYHDHRHTCLPCHGDTADPVNQMGKGEPDHHDHPPFSYDHLCDCGSHGNLLPDYRQLYVVRS